MIESGDDGDGVEMQRPNKRFAASERGVLCCGPRDGAGAAKWRAVRAARATKRPLLSVLLVL